MGIETDISRIAEALENINLTLGKLQEHVATTPAPPKPRTRRSKAEIAAEAAAAAEVADAKLEDAEEEAVAAADAAEIAEARGTETGADVTAEEADPTTTPTFPNIVTVCKELMRRDPNILRGVLDQFKAPTIKDIKAADYPKIMRMLVEAANG